MPTVGKFYMKFLIPQGKGGWYVHEFNAESFADIDAVRNELMSEGWGDATAKEYDNFLSAAEAIGEIAGNKAEWIRIEDLTEDEKLAVRKFVAGEGPLTPEEVEMDEAGPSEDAEESDEEAETDAEGSEESEA